MGVLEDIQEQYPTLAFLLNDPEVGPLLKKAVDPNSTYSPSRFQAELMQTRWWTSRSQSAREYEIQRHTDPGTHRTNFSNAQTQIRNKAAQLGVVLRPSEINFLSTLLLKEGVELEDPRILGAMMQIRRSSPSRQRDGMIRTTANAARTQARGQWYLTMSKGSAQRWAEWIAKGEKTQDDLTAYLQRQAASKYQHLAGSIQSGQTMDEIFGEHRAAIANLLDLDPNQVNLMDGKWKQVLHYHDPKTRQHRAMTIAESEYLARQDHRFWNTRTGREQDAQMADMFSKMFGERA